MNNAKMQLALRQWQAQMTQVPTLVALGGVGVVLGILGPFNTSGLLGLVVAIIYWLVVVVLCYGAGALVHSLVRAFMGQRSMLLLIAIAGSGTTIFVLVIVTAMNAVIFDFIPSSGEWPQFAGTIFAICMIVSATLTYILGTTAQTGNTAPQAPTILDRVPLDKRGPLIALSVEDHYVRIRTSKGDELVLLRLSDAMRETSGATGAQVHRSHWVAFDQVKTARRENGRAILTMRDDSEVPVSRAHIKTIKDAGLLPK